MQMGRQRPIGAQLRVEVAILRLSDPIPPSLSSRRSSRGHQTQAQVSGMHLSIVRPSRQRPVREGDQEATGVHVCMRRQALWLAQTSTGS